LKLDNWLEQRARTGPDRPALMGPDSALSYGELEEAAVDVARRLAARGVRRGATVGLSVGQSVFGVILIHALMKLGVVTVPLSPRLTASEVESALQVAKAGMVISDEEQLPHQGADMPLLAEHEMDELHCRILTSGSSGPPKAVGLTYGNHLFSAMGSAFNLGVDPADRWLCVLPLSHISGLAIVMRSTIYGTTMVLAERFTPSTVAEAIQNRGVNVISLVSTMLTRLLDEDVDLSPTRAVLVGGGPVSPEVISEALERGYPVVQTYGLTEACSQVTTLRLDEARRKVGSAGRPLLTSHLRIVDGEILIQGPTVSPEVIDTDGWLHTGDLGRIDDEGFLYVEGRLDDRIISGGENIAPAEIEAVLKRHSGIQQVEVTGRPDEEWSEIVVAKVVARPGVRLDPDEIREFCRGSLASFKVPREIEIVEAPPGADSQ
jgi:O-succinylbenzoic acid--CoA ligase